MGLTRTKSRVYRVSAGHTDLADVGPIARALAVSARLWLIEAPQDVYTST